MEEGETAVGDSPNWPYPSAAVKELDDKAGLSEPTVGQWVSTPGGGLYAGGWGQSVGCMLVGGASLLFPPLQMHQRESGC